tara:strand:+ start:761 stop:925 length:165 start_codon:yes stop_codon:yes gene_type:complete
MSEKKEKGKRHDGKSRVSNDLYRKRWDEIFGKPKDVVITEASFKSRDYEDKEDK